MATLDQLKAAPSTTWTIDPAHTTVEFAIKHMMVSTVKGHFGPARGTIVIDPADPLRSSVEVTIDASGVDTREAQRDAHLRSADFLDVEHYPHITFKSTRVEPVGEDRFRVVGDLTIRDVTRPVVLDTTFNGEGVSPWGQRVASFTATTRISRKDFGLTWNLALETGGWLVGDEVKILIETEATQQR